MARSRALLPGLSISTAASIKWKITGTFCLVAVSSMAFVKMAAAWSNCLALSRMYDRVTTAVGWVGLILST